jgi:hypothetical protein
MEIIGLHSHRSITLQNCSKEQRIYWPVSLNLMAESGSYFLASQSSNNVEWTEFQPREYSWGATWKKKQRDRPRRLEYGRREQSRWPRGTLYPQNLALTWPTSDGWSVGIVCSWTQATEFSSSNYYIKDGKEEMKSWCSV